VSDSQPTENQYIAATRCWLESVVIELNLCPFAGQQLRDDRVKFSVTNAATEVQLLQALEAELELLSKNVTIETTLLIHPQVLADFEDYNQFLGLADGLLEQMQLDGVFQIASFHPDYQFADSHPDDAENYTNRSPHPILHILLSPKAVVQPTNKQRIGQAANGQIRSSDNGVASICSLQLTKAKSQYRSFVLLQQSI